MAEMETGSAYSPSYGTQSEETSRAGRVMEQGKEQAAKVGGVARKKVMSKVDARKSEFSSNLDRIADSIESAGDGLEGGQAEIATRVAGYVRKAKEVLDGHSSDEILDRAVTEVRNRPGAMIAGAFALGFLATRLAKS